MRAANPQQTAAQVLAEHPELQAGFVAGNKQGFCVIDLVPLTPLPIQDAKYRSCGSNQGISVGWADEYKWTLDGQWVVVDDVPPGSYVLEAEVNAERLYVETNYANNMAAAPVALA